MSANRDAQIALLAIAGRVPVSDFLVVKTVRHVILDVHRTITANGDAFRQDKGKWPPHGQHRDVVMDMEIEKVRANSPARRKNETF